MANLGVRPDTSSDGKSYTQHRTTKRKEDEDDSRNVGLICQDCKKSSITVESLKEGLIGQWLGESGRKDHDNFIMLLANKQLPMPQKEVM